MAERRTRGNTRKEIEGQRQRAIQRTWDGFDVGRRVTFVAVNVHARQQVLRERMRAVGDPSRGHTIGGYRFIAPGEIVEVARKGDTNRYPCDPRCDQCGHFNCDRCTRPDACHAPSPDAQDFAFFRVRDERSGKIFRVTFPSVTTMKDNGRGPDGEHGTGLSEALFRRALQKDPHTRLVFVEKWQLQPYELASYIRNFGGAARGALSTIGTLALHNTDGSFTLADEEVDHAP